MAMEFIEVRRIVNGKRGQQVVHETMLVDDIKTFRPWHKSDTDTFKGEATMIVLKQNAKVADHATEIDRDCLKDVENIFKNYGYNQDNIDSFLKKRDNLNTMMINEDYNDFLKRMSGRVILNVK